jgi:preprotein translocase subunit SecE
MGVLKLKKLSNHNYYIYMSILSHIQESRAEMKHVKWPTKKQVISYTTAVIVLSLIIAIYIGALDALFARVLGWLISTTQ